MTIGKEAVSTWKHGGPLKETEMRCARMLPLILVLVAATTMTSSPAAGHGAIHEQIVAVTKRIEAEPGQAGLYLQRAELYRVDRSWDEALNDYDRASALDAELAVVDLARAEMLLEAERPEAALRSIDAHLRARPDGYKGRIARARILTRLERKKAAAAEFRRAVAVLDPAARPDPEDFLDQARAFAAVGRLDEALRGLEEGMTRLGRLVALELLAIELERADGRVDSALGRVEAFAARSPRKETWWVLRGEILGQAGRSEEARRAFEEALAAIESLPAGRRATRRTSELEERVRSELAKRSDHPNKKP